MNDAPKILAADPHASWRAHAPAIDAAIRRVLESGRYILGPEVDAFEREWAAWLGTGFAIGVANGTDAIELALRGAGVAAGDVVVTVANTVTATIAAIERAGARVALVDIDPATMTLDVAALAAWLDQPGSPRVRAVVPVHLYGHPADVPALLVLAERHGFTVVEDCAQCHGARFGGRMSGTMGAVAAFSFYPTKNLGALGDGGAVVTSDPAIAERVRALRQYGWRQRYVAEEPGMNSRLDEVQAAVLRVKLAALARETERRRAIATRYRTELAGTAVILPTEAADCEHVWHQFVVRHPRREHLRQHLERSGILSAVLYPTPIHHQPAYRDRVLIAPGGLPETERACREVLSLPVYPELTDDEIGRVIAAARPFEV
jgi:dTDP-4-amino-4,6-dideoxygalactose transaminase